MAEIAFITATRNSCQKMVAVSSDKIDFKRPIQHETIIELIGKAINFDTTS